MTKLIVMIFATCALVGCRTEPTTTGDANFPTRQNYNVPPKQLLQKVKAVVGLPIASEQDGRIVTDWEMQKGARFGVAGAARTWQERTRYTITIAPAWDDPNNRSSIEVTEETQQRPHDKYEWGSQEPVKRPERAAQMAKKIDTALNSAAATK
jgi:hypothetical protein